MSSKAVNVPTDVKTKEKDVNGKLQLYGIYEAFSKGKVPSNKQIDVAINSALAWKQLQEPSKKLSPDGQKLVKDLRSVIEQAKLLLLSKNQGDLLQQFIWQTEHIGAGNANGVHAPVDKNTAKQHGDQATEGLRTLAKLIITNGQFRKLLSDASVLVRDIFGDAAQNVASHVKPNEEQLEHLDDAAPDNTWHDEPNLSKDHIKSQLQSKTNIGGKGEAKGEAKSEAKKIAGDVSQAASGSRDPHDAANVAKNDAEQGNKDTSLDVHAAKDTAKSKVHEAESKAKQAVDENVDEDDKQKARAYREKTNEYFKKKMPKERREQTIYRLKKMVVEIQGASDYQQAIDTILRLAEEYNGHAQNVAGQTQGAAKGAHSQDSLKSAETNLRILLERFANSTSFDDLFDSINEMYKHADTDPELKKWFKEMNSFIRKCLKEQGYILQDESNEAWNKLYDQGQFLLRDRYKDDTNRIVDETKFLAEQFEKDPQNKQFADSMNKLFNDLGHDENGKAEFKPHLLKDLSEVILPGFFTNVRYVPIPRIEFSDPMLDVVIENLVIEGDNLAPNQMEFGSDNYWRWGRKTFTSKNKNSVLLSVSGIQMDLRDVAYYIKKKEGFPGVTDKGVMDVFLGGTGLSFKVAMETADKTDKQHFFKISKITVELKNLNIKLKQSNHKLLFGLFKPLLFKVIRPAIQKAVEKQIRDSVTKADAFLYQVKKEVDRVTEEAKNNPDPEHLQNIYQKYFNAFQKQLSKGEQKKKEMEAKKDQTKVNVAVTQHDSIFKNISLPGGISTKATEYKDLAAKGDEWQSPVFSIGSASESTNLPAAADPSRKPHNVRQGGLRNKGESGSATGTSFGNTGGNNGGIVGLDNNPIGVPTQQGAGFSSQVDDAFKTDNTTGTTLGRGNPVYQGSA